jgi:hypothetical protein
MQKNQTHFEQVPIETIRGILEEDAQQLKLETPTKPEPKIVEGTLLPAAAGTRSGGRK